MDFWLVLPDAANYFYIKTLVQKGSLYITDNNMWQP